MSEGENVRTWRAEVPPEPEGVTCVRDENGHGDLWRKADDGWRLAAMQNGTPYPNPRRWEEIVTEFGPLVEVIEP
jgi:hypothetical protein